MEYYIKLFEVKSVAPVFTRNRLMQTSTIFSHLCEVMLQPVGLEIIPQYRYYYIPLL